MIVVAASVLVVAGLSLALWLILRSTEHSSTTPDAGPSFDDETAPAAAPVPEASGDESIDDAAQYCFDGTLYWCDALFTPDAPEAHARYGSTCGGRAPEQRGECLVYFLGEPAPPTDLGNDPDLDALAEDCFAEDWQACDDLYLMGDVGSFYEAYGLTCGGRLPPPLESHADCRNAEA
jgi:hypothetical protein